MCIFKKYSTGNYAMKPSLRTSAWQNTVGTQVLAHLLIQTFPPSLSLCTVFSCHTEYMPFLEAYQAFMPLWKGFLLPRTRSLPNVDDFLLILQGWLSTFSSTRFAPPTLLSKLSSSSLEQPGYLTHTSFTGGVMGSLFPVKGQIGSSTLQILLSLLQLLNSV